jgi:uncharacterized short protein YbdD (DUF466 family)
MSTERWCLPSHDRIWCSVRSCVASLGEGFWNRKDFIQHMRREHGDRSYTQVWCPAKSCAASLGEGFKDGDDFILHMRQNHKDEPNTLMRCPDVSCARIYRFWRFMIHLRMNHAREFAAYVDMIME